MIVLDRLRKLFDRPLGILDKALELFRSTLGSCAAARSIPGGGDDACGHGENLCADGGRRCSNGAHRCSNGGRRCSNRSGDDGGADHNNLYRDSGGSGDHSFLRRR